MYSLIHESRKAVWAAALCAVTSCLLVTELNAQQRLTASWPEATDAEARSLIEEGDALLGEQSYAAARAKYVAAVERSLAKQEFPAKAMYRIAASYWHEGLAQTAASQMDELAEMAASYGDVVTQIWALADAAWIHGQAGHKIDMELRVERVKRLLKSPYLPADVRAEIASKRLGEVTTLVEG